MRNKKWLALMLASVMSMSVLAGCQNQGEKPAVSNGNEVKEITVVFDAEPSSVFAGNSAELNQATLDYVEETLGIRVNVLSIPHESYQEKLNLMLNAGDSIDAFYIQSVKEYGPMNIRRGFAADITEYIQASDELSRVNPSFFSQLTSGDKIYGVPTAAPNDQVLWIRKDILDQYGAKVPTTTDELYTELKKLADSDIIPLCMPKWMNNFQFYYNAFDAWRGLRVLEDGTWVDGFNTPEMRDALEYLNMLYTDGIMDMEFITTENSTMREKMFNSTAASCLYWGNWYAGAISQFLDQDIELVCVPSLIGPDGHEGGTLNQGVSNAYMVHAKSDDIDAAATFVTWLTGSVEGARLTSIGVEGAHYTVNANGEYEATQAAIDAGFSISSGIGAMCPDPLDIKLPADQAAPIEKNQEFLVETYAKSGPLYEVPVGVCDAYDKISASYIEKMNEIAANAIITGDIDGAMKEYEAYWKSIDGDGILAELNK